MERTRHLATVLLLALFATACSSSYTVPGALPESGSVQGDIVDPQWHVTTEASAIDTQATGSTVSVEFPEALNAGADFDLFVMDLFPSAQPEQFGPLQTVIAGYCSGLVDADSIGFLTQDPEIQKTVLDIPSSTCSSMETSSLLLPSSPVDAVTWDEAVHRRFARTVWWYDESAFAARALAACQAGESAASLDSDFDLGLSVIVELAAFTKHGDCALLTVEDGASVRTGSAADAAIVAEDPDTDVTLYFLRANEAEIADRKRDLYALSVATGEVTRLTTGQNLKRVSLSPDGSLLAYLADIEGNYDQAMLSVIDLASGSERALGPIEGITDLLWAPDGSGLIHSIESEDGTRVIGVFDIAEGVSSVLVEPTRDRVWSSGIAGSHLLYEDTDGHNHQLVRYDLLVGEIVDAVEVPYGRTSISPDGSLVIKTERSSGEMSLIDMEADEMVLTAIASGPGLEAGVAISPDNRFAVYGVGPEFRANQIFLTDLSAPETRVHLTAEMETTEVGTPIWAPDSQSVFFGDGPFDFESMYMVAIDGTVTDLGQTGRPLVVVGGS